MTVTDTTKDPEARRLAITATYTAPATAVWALWADPRRLERWWGPPTHPATFVEHDLTPGARTTYFMTGPEGERYHGWWQIVAVDEPRRLAFDDGFSDGDGAPDPTQPVTAVEVTLAEDGDGRTTMVVASTFPSIEAMEQLLAMGMAEGMAQAMTQIDALLAEPA